MATFVVLRHPVTILVTNLTNPNNLTNDPLLLRRALKQSDKCDNKIDPQAVQHFDNWISIFY